MTCSSSYRFLNIDICLNVIALLSMASCSTATLDQTDVVLQPDRSGQTVFVRQSQVIGIPSPAPGMEWQVSFDSTFLESLIPLDRMRVPGVQGWIFRAIAPGETELSLTSIAAPCKEGRPCPRTVMQFSYVIKIVE